jgi:hypothetical protein
MLTNGATRLVIQLRGKGRHRLVATYAGTGWTASSSASVSVKVT